MNQLIEIWKEIGKWETYQVSNLGNVRNKKTNHMLSKRNVKGGYLQVKFSNQGKEKLFLINRLVAHSFHGMDLSDKSVYACHKDDDPSNNAEWNIFVGTPKENCDDKIKKGRARYTRGDIRGCNKLSEKDVIQIRLLAKEKKLSRKKISEYFGCSERQVYKILSGDVFNWLT